MLNSITARRRLLRLALGLCLGLAFGLLSAPQRGLALERENTLYLDLKTGRVVIEMRPELAPRHVRRIKELVRQGYYDGKVFHRVIPGFMAQGGSARGQGVAGSGKTIDAEFSNEPHVRGTVSMARTDDPNSADAQFFIVFRRQPHLDGKYTIWGKVISGMVHVGRIKRGDEASGGVVEDPDRIIRMRIAADVKD